jgi:D-arabinose 1-dehydrogenase-like Zn-dependent alcohol dehydrogenase
MEERIVKPVTLPTEISRLTIQRVKTEAALLNAQNTAVCERDLRLQSGEVAAAATLGR